MKNSRKITVFFLFCMAFFQVSCKSDEIAVQQAGDFLQTSPVSAETGVSALTTFSWKTALNAESYHLVVSVNADFTAPEFDISNITETKFTLTTGLVPNTRYFWKVTAENKSGSKTASNAGIFFRIKAETPEPSTIGSSYYVSPDGDDNPGRGTQVNPFKTLAFAASMVPAACSDTIFLSAGTFEETEPAMIPIAVSVIGAGESQTILSSKGVKIPVTVNSSDPDFKLWYDGSLIQLVSPHNALFRNTKSTVIAPENGNQMLSGFTIDGNDKSLKAGIWVENRDNVTMHHVTFKNLEQRGAVFAPGNKDWYVYPKYYMKGTNIHNCTFINSGKDLTDETLGNLCIAQLDGAEIYNINITDSEGYGIKFIYDGYFINMKIHDCNISLNEFDPKWGEDIAIELWNVGPGNEIGNINCNTWLSIVNHPEMFGTPSGTENMKIHDVKMIDKDGISNIEAIEVGAPGVEISDSYFENKGIGMAIWDMGRSNITIRNNIFYNSVIHDNWAGGPSIYIDNSHDWDFKNIFIYNNVFDIIQTGIIIKGSLVSDIDIKNNIFLHTSVSDVESSTDQNVSFDHNLKFFGNSDVWVLVGIEQGGNNIIQNPGFLQSGDRWGTYYQAASAESAIVDKGTYVGQSFNGLAPDIGRWEF